MEDESRLFAAADALATGYVTTALHWTFFALQISAAIGASSRSQHVAA